MKNAGRYLQGLNEDFIFDIVCLLKIYSFICADVMTNLSHQESKLKTEYPFIQVRTCDREHQQQ